MLDLGRLRALHAVAVHGSVGAAASALGYTPSAVSQQIAKLERETRTTLLERSGRGIRLTDEAHQLADTAQQLLALVEEAEVRIEERRGLPSGRLTIGCFASAARGLMPRALAELARRHPDLDARLSEVDPHLSIDLVARGVIDLAVAHDWDIAPLPTPPGSSGRPSATTCATSSSTGGIRWRPGSRCGGRSWRTSGGSRSRRGRSATPG